MGQGYSLATLPSGAGALETPEISDLSFERALGGSRFLRTIRAQHRDGIVVAKICNKPSTNVSFKKYVRLLKAERQALIGVPNALAYQRIFETANIGLLVRQFVNISLYDRMSIRPFLETIEKKWIAFQLLCAVRDCHARGVFHGDIKSENVLVTSWGWAYLTDFSAAFKPVYLPEDNPADFSFYFDVAGRRTCYLAPERFLAVGEKSAEDDLVQWNMDIFSLGCVIAELFTETPTFTLSQLFKYRKREHDPTIALLGKIDDDQIRALIGSMIRLDPQDRWHAQDYLDEYKNKVFPLYFYQHLHVLMQEITDPTSGRRVAHMPGANNGLSDDRIDRIYEDFEMLSFSLGYTQAEAKQPSAVHMGTGRGLFPLQVDVPNNRHSASPALQTSSEHGTFILLNVITASMRSTARAASKVRACELLLAFAERLPDEAKLDRVLPYVMQLLDDVDEMVLVATLRTTAQLLALVRVVSPVNSFLFTQYIFPRLQQFVNSSQFRKNGIVRATYAACLASLAQSASRFLDIMQALRAEGLLPSTDRGAEDETSGYSAYHDAYDATRQEVLEQFEGQTKVFLTDQDTAVRRAFLTSVPSLCVFFGETKASDVLLSHLNTYLNDPDWLLKCGFFRTIVGVAVYIGGASLEEFILPLMIQALTDPQEFVVEQALRSLSSMAEVGLLQRQKTWELIDIVARFHMHPNLWIREAASHFVSAATTYLSLADIRILVAPLIKPYLKVPVPTMSEMELLDSLKKPLPRAVLDLSLQWAADNSTDKGLFWKQSKDAHRLSYRGTASMPPVSSVADLNMKSLSRLPKTEEDERWLGRLRNAGMRGDDELKLLAFREVLWRTAQRSRRKEDKSADEMLDRIITLTQLKITPQTVLFDNQADTYEERMRGDDHERTIAEALMEASKPVRIDSADGENGAGTEQPYTEARIIPRRLSVGLRKQTSGSMSSSPGSGVGLLGRDAQRMPLRKDGQGRLLPGLDNRKTFPDVAMDGTTAIGRLDTPQTGSRRTSPAPLSAHGRQKLERSVSHRTVHDYTGNDPTVLKLLDTVYVDNFPVDASDFGPLIQPMKRGPIRSRNAQTVSKLWRPQGQLMAVLGEHTARVNRIAIAPDHTFFVTASDDGSVKVWDSARLERNVTNRSRQTHRLAPGVRVTSLCFVTSTHTFVCTGSDGSVQALKVDVSEPSDSTKATTYGKLQVAREWHIPTPAGQNEYAVWTQHYRAESVSVLVLATNRNRIMGINLRYMSIMFEFQNPAQHGQPTCFCISRKQEWLLVGTSNGVLDLWDLRFRVRLRSWTLAHAVPVTRLQVHPSRKSSRRNRVVVSGGTARGEITVWDIEKVICHEIYRPALPESWQSSHARDRDYKLINIDDVRPESQLGRVAGAITADAGTAEDTPAQLALSTSLFVGQQQVSEDSDTQNDFIISGGPDGRVRFWDCERLDGCRLVSGGGLQDKPEYTFSPLPTLPRDCKILSEHFPEPAPEAVTEAVQSNKISANTAVRRTGGAGKPSRHEVIRLSAQHLLDGHLDTITDVALLEKPFGMIVSADRSGQVFVHQ